MLRRVGFGLVTVVVLSVTVGALAFGAGTLVSEPVDSGTGTTDFTATQADEFDSTVFRIVVYGDGDARWIVEHRRILSTTEEESQFREFADQFRTSDTETFQNFRVRANTLTDSGTETTGREMNATDFQRNASVDPLGQTSGVVRMSFHWEGFATVDGDTVVVADVFGGGWGIIEDQRLTILPGDGVVFSEVAPNPDSMTVTGNLTASDSITWFGERQFADERPRVVFVPPPQTGGPAETPTPSETDSASDTPTDSTPGESPDEGGSPMALPLVVLAVLVLLGAGGGVMWYTGALSQSGPDVSDSSEGATASSQTEPAVPEEELLSDEDRVIQLLEDNGGRMKQVAIVEETEWSKSKVSMLLSDMDEEGQISKLRVGRENIISLSGEEPEAAGSPFDDE